MIQQIWYNTRMQPNPDHVPTDGSDHFGPQRPNPFANGCVTEMNGTMEQTRPRGAKATALAAWSDEKLLFSYRDSGDRRAFEELVGRYEHELFGYLKHYLSNAEMAEDVFQQTFLQVHLKCKQFESGRKVRPWLYAVATNQAIDCQRRNRRHRMASLDRQLGPASQDDQGALLKLLDSTEPDPAEQSESAEQYIEVRRALEELPEQTRHVVMLVYYQGLKYREAAEILAIPVGTVKSRLHAAIQKLNESLGRTHLPK
jgi:RNA polymerase sigma-70 factor, ECF subfamily